ncbi:MAG: hypothetical protein ACK559_27345, partial [bacterium]
GRACDLPARHLASRGAAGLAGLARLLPALVGPGLPAAVGGVENAGDLLDVEEGVDPVAAALDALDGADAQQRVELRVDAVAADAERGGGGVDVEHVVAQLAGEDAEAQGERLPRGGGG